MFIITQYSFSVFCSWADHLYTTSVVYDCLARLDLLPMPKISSKVSPGPQSLEVSVRNALKLVSQDESNQPFLRLMQVRVISWSKWLAEAYTCDSTLVPQDVWDERLSAAWDHLPLCADVADLPLGGFSSISVGFEIHLEDHIGVKLPQMPPWFNTIGISMLSTSIDSRFPPQKTIIVKIDADTDFSEYSLCNRVPCSFLFNDFYPCTYFMLQPSFPVSTDSLACTLHLGFSTSFAEITSDAPAQLYCAESAITWHSRQWSSSPQHISHLLSGLLRTWSLVYWYYLR